MIRTLAWNAGTCRADGKGDLQAAESSATGHGPGAQVHWGGVLVACSEGDPAMGLERRCHLDRYARPGQPESRGLRWLLCIS